MKRFLSFSSLKLYYCILFGLVIIMNSVSLGKYMTKFSAWRRSHPYYFTGSNFSGLQSLLRASKYVGYYTDKNLDINQHAAQFAQAQYSLAPIILDFNNTDHDYIIFDCRNELLAILKMKEINALPFKRSILGMILAKKISKKHGNP